jgi:hypothetical protein
MGRRKRLVIAVTASVAAALGAVALPTQPATADVAGWFATANFGSDPHIIGCTDPATNTNGYCLYTSQDMGQQYAYKPANHYPMRDTKAYFSPNGYSNWVDKGTVFTESMLDSWAGERTDCVSSGTERVAKAPDVAPNCRAYHLWAPSAIKDGNTYYLFVPDVSDTRNTGTPNIHTSSRIAVASSSSPFGPFTYLGTVDHSSGYMSDPDVAIDPIDGTRYLIWADGDNGNCGGLKSAKMNSNWRTIQPGTTQTLVINGIEVLGNCGGKGRPYLEGASIYKNLAAVSLPGVWTLIFAAKPTSTPTDCDANNAAPGTAQTDHEVIAWATSNNAQGPYTYQGIIMCGSTTEWTNQATIATIVANGLPMKIIIYHDSAANVKQRKLHAECLYYGSDHIGGVYRQAPSAQYGFNDCIASGPNGTYQYKGLWGQDPQYPTKAPIMSVDGGNGDVIAKRYAVGPWERYRFELVSGTNVYVIRALANGKLLCAPNSSTPIKPSCTSSNDVTARFIREATNHRSHFRLKSVQNNLYVSIAGNGRLYTSATGTSTAATFAPLSPTGG